MPIRLWGLLGFWVEEKSLLQLECVLGLAVEEFRGKGAYHEHRDNSEWVRCSFHGL